MCELLTVMDSMIVQVALSGLDNILKAGELHNAKPNPYAVLIEECYGIIKYSIYPSIDNCLISKYLFSLPIHSIRSGQTRIFAISRNERDLRKGVLHTREIFQHRSRRLSCCTVAGEQPIPVQSGGNVWLWVLIIA